MSKSFPHGTKDLTPLLKEAKAANVDAFMGMVYLMNLSRHWAGDELILIPKRSFNSWTHVDSV